MKNNLQKKNLIIYVIKKHLEKSNTHKKYIGKSVDFLHRNFSLSQMLLIPFKTYTMIAGTLSLNFSPALLSGTFPFVKYVHKNNPISLFLWK